MNLKVKKSATQSFTPFTEKWVKTSSHEINYKLVYKVLD